MLADQRRGLKSISTHAAAAPEAGAILVLFPGALGDAVCLEPTLARLGTEGRIVLYARAAAAEVARLFPVRPEVRSLDAPEIARLFAPLDDPGGEPRDADWLESFERIVSFTGASEPAFRERLARTGRATLAPFPRGHLAAHVSDHFLRRATGEPTAVAAPPRLLLDEGAGGAGCDRGRAGRRPRLVIHPGAGSRAKRAPLALFEEIARRWRERAGGVVSALQGPAEAGEAGWDALGTVSCPASVAHLAREIAAADAFVGNDSGPSHVAAALGVCGVALFVGGDPAAFAPRGDTVATLAVDEAPPGEITKAALRLLRLALP